MNGLNLLAITTHSEGLTLLTLLSFIYTDESGKQHGTSLLEIGYDDGEFFITALFGLLFFSLRI